MAIDFPANLIPIFPGNIGETDPTIKSIQDIVASNIAFTNKVQANIDIVLANIVSVKADITSLIVILDGYVITPPDAWLLSTADIQDIADALLVVSDDLDLLTAEINTNFKPHTDRLSGVSYNDNTVLKSNLTVTYSITSAAMALGYKQDDKINRIPLVFGSIFSGNDTLTTANTNVTNIGTSLTAIDIDNKITNNLDTSANMIIAIQAITGTSANVTALAGHVVSDDNAFNSALNFLLAGLAGTSINGYARNDFDRFFWKDVVAGASLADLLSTIEVTNDPPQ